MDDINIGCSGIFQARKLLCDIDLILQARAIRLNSGKTRIICAEDAQHHFRLRHNARLDAIEKVLERLAERMRKGDKTSIKLHKRYQKLWNATLIRMYNAGQFDDGNGEKILKRMITVAKARDWRMDDEMLFRILVERPGPRERAFEMFERTRPTVKFLTKLRKLVSRGSFVDDAAFLWLARCLVGMRCTKRPEKIYREVKTIVSEIPRDRPLKVLACIMIASKYMTANEILDLLCDTRSLWETEPALGRWIGGVRPRLERTKSWASYRNMVRGCIAREAREVFEFHGRIKSDERARRKIWDIVRAVNPKERNGITFAKMLIMWTMLGADGVSSKEKRRLIEAHKKAWGDVFLQRETRRVVADAELQQSVRE